MTRALTDLFKVNGVRMLAPDNEQNFNFEDIDAADAGRTEDGYMHRNPVRYKVGTWSFSFAKISEQDKRYIESLFPDEATFEFTHPDRKDSSITVTTTCYRSKYSLSWYSARDGVWKNYSFNIIEC